MAERSQGSLGANLNHVTPSTRLATTPATKVDTNGPAGGEISVQARGQTSASHETEGKQVLPPLVSVVIPTLNEAQNIPGVLARVPQWVYEIIVVDGGSLDGTPAAARAARGGIRVISQEGRGKGNALACGFAEAKGDIIVTLDADGSTDPEEIPRFVAALRTGADLAKGTRFITGGGSSDITRLRKWGNVALAKTVNVLFGVHYSDLCYGYNAFWRRCLPLLSVDCSGFEVETLLNVKAVRRRLSVVEVASHENGRMQGRSNLSARQDGLRVLRTIVAERIRPI